jgi:hypothetical protein
VPAPGGSSRAGALCLIDPRRAPSPPSLLTLPLAVPDRDCLARRAPRRGTPARSSRGPNLLERQVSPPHVEDSALEAQRTHRAAGPLRQSSRDVNDRARHRGRLDRLPQRLLAALALHEVRRQIRSRVHRRLRLHLPLDKPKPILWRKPRQPLQVRPRARHLTCRPIREHRMNVQHPASLYLPHASHQEHGPAPKSFHRVLIRPPVKPSPSTGSLAIPTSRRRLLHATSELPRMLVLPQARAHPLVPRQAARTRSSDSTQQDVARQDLQVAEKLMALIGRPHMAVLRTAPTPTHVPAPIQRTTTATAASNDRVNCV